VARRSLADVYDALRNKILTGELPPLSRLKEQEVAAQFSLSRTPVREALARLEMEGLIRRSPGRSAVVCPVEMDEVDEIYQIRAALETLVAQRACERATDDEIQAMACELTLAQSHLEAGDIDNLRVHTVRFHHMLNASSRSPRLIAMLRSLEERLVSFRQKGLRYPGRGESAMRQHWAILEGLRRRDEAEMRRWVEEHAEVGRQTAIKTHLEEGRERRMAEQPVPELRVVGGRAGGRLPPANRR
jgi:DNA-binding GntR family transcriptional regulator